MASGVQVDAACPTEHGRVKMGYKDGDGPTIKNKFVIFKLSDDMKKVVVDVVGEPDKTYDDFEGALAANAQPRYAVMDVAFESADGRPQTKLVFFFWCPDDSATIKQKMVYASSKDALKKKLEGLQTEIQANERSELTLGEVEKALRRV